MGVKSNGRKNAWDENEIRRWKVMNVMREEIYWVRWNMTDASLQKGSEYMKSGVKEDGEKEQESART